MPNLLLLPELFRLLHRLHLACFFRPRFFFFFVGHPLRWVSDKAACFTHTAWFFSSSCHSTLFPAADSVCFPFLPCAAVGPDGTPYDYSCPVTLDTNSGMKSMTLRFNEGEDPEIVATRFCEENRLPMGASFFVLLHLPLVCLPACAVAGCFCCVSQLQQATVVSLAAVTLSAVSCFYPLLLPLLQSRCRRWPSSSRRA